MEKEYSYQNRSNRTNAGPYGISSAYGQTLRGFGQQPHTHNGKHQEAGHPAPPSQAFNGFCPSEAVSKADLAEAGNN